MAAMENTTQLHAEKEIGLRTDIIENVSQKSELENEAATGGRAWNATCILSCCTIGASSVLFGYDDKIVSPVAAMGPFIDHVQGTGTSSVLTARNQQLVFCVPLVGAIVGALLASPVTSRFGRKWPIVVAYAFSIAGTMLQTFSPNLAAFVVGRFFNAILMAVSMTITPLYLSELVPAKYRGRAVTSPNVFNLISGVVGTIIANATHTQPGKSAYMIPIGLQAVMPAILIPLTALVPESPLWLMMHGREDEARHNLGRIRNTAAVSIESEFRVMKVTHDKEVALAQGATFFDLFRGKNLIRTLVAGSMFSVNQVTGIILSTTYATVFLTQLGVGNPFQLTIAAACCTLAGTLLAPLLVDRVGRRPIAMVGMSTLLLIDIVCGTLAFYMGLPNVPNVVAALSFIFNVFWASSFYALSLTLPAEIPTPRLRNLTSAYTIGASYVTAVLTTVVVPQLTSADAANLGAKAYLVFAGCVAFVLVFYYIYLPETAGRTFAEIDEMYEAGVPPRKWKGYVCSAEVKETH